MSMYFYDRQIRRWIQQIIAVFSNFNVQIGVDPTGAPTYQRVPVRYGDMTRMAAAIIRENAENKTNTVPIMTISITSLKYERDRIQNPTFVDKLHIRERKYNDATDTYSVYQGNAVTVERLMPVPYDLTVNLDIWTSNTEQKLQLLEQILPLFNPDLEIQSTDNFIDWTSLSYITLEDQAWSSRTIPQGTDDSIDVATLTFRMPIWLSLPAKVKKLGVIQTIVASLYDAQGEINEDVINTANLLKNRMYITPTGYNLLLLNGQATLLPAMGPVTKPNTIADLETNPNDPILWQPLVNLYGQLINGTSQLRLRKDNPDTISEVIGTVAYHPSDPSSLLFSVNGDTIPSNSMPPVNAIIDPYRSGPGAGLPAAIHGQRYLILSAINTGKPAFDGADAWKDVNGRDLVANANDIITYSGTGWQVAWSASQNSQTEFVTNLKTGVQYKWSDGKWQKSYEGVYPAGQWSLVL